MATGSEAARRGSVTTMTRRAPSRFMSNPTSAVAPGPNLMLDVSMVKMVSCVMPESPVQQSPADILPPGPSAQSHHMAPRGWSGITWRSRSAALAMPSLPACRPIRHRRDGSQCLGLSLTPIRRSLVAGGRAEYLCGVRVTLSHRQTQEVSAQSRFTTMSEPVSGTNAWHSSRTADEHGSHNSGQAGLAPTARGARVDALSDKLDRAHPLAVHGSGSGTHRVGTRHRPRNRWRRRVTRSRPRVVMRGRAEECVRVDRPVRVAKGVEVRVHPGGRVLLRRIGRVDLDRSESGVLCGVRKAQPDDGGHDDSPRARCPENRGVSAASAPLSGAGLSVPVSALRAVTVRPRGVS